VVTVEESMADDLAKRCPDIPHPILVDFVKKAMDQDREEHNPNPDHPVIRSIGGISGSIQRSIEEYRAVGRNPTKVVPVHKSQVVQQKPEKPTTPAPISAADEAMEAMVEVFVAKYPAVPRAVIKATIDGYSKGGSPSLTAERSKSDLDKYLKAMNSEPEQRENEVSTPGSNSSRP